MSDLKTDQIYKKITDKAIEKEKERIEQILWDAHSAIGLGGTCTEVELRDNNSKTCVKVYSNTMIQALAKKRLEEVKGRIAQKAVDDFIASVAAFKKHLETIENYQLMNGDDIDF